METTWEPLLHRKNVNCDGGTVGAQCWQLCGLKTPGVTSNGETLLLYFPSGAWRNSHSKCQKKTFLLLLAGEGEKPLWSPSEHSVLPNKACPQGKPLNHSLTCWGIILSEAKWPGTGNTQLWSAVAILSHLRGKKKNWETLTRFTVQIINSLKSKT